MQYQGGKEKIAARLVEAFPDKIDVYVEPFVGGLSVGSRVKANNYILADGNEALITLYKAWADGWRPVRVTEDDYQALKAAKDPSNPYTAFAGFGVSFGAKYFGGFARCNGGRDYFAIAVNSLAKKMDRLPLERVQFVHALYEGLVIPEGAFVYCDPPYSGTTGYPGMPAFDSGAFWEWAQAKGAWVSEYEAPQGWGSALDLPKKVTLSRGPQIDVLERLFRYSKEVP